MSLWDDFKSKGGEILQDGATKAVEKEIEKRTGTSTVYRTTDANASVAPAGQPSSDLPADNRKMWILGAVAAILGGLVLVAVIKK